MLRAIAPLIKFAAVGLLLVTIATIRPLSRFHLMELCSHFRVQIAIIGFCFWLMLWRERTPVVPRIRFISWRMLAFLPILIQLVFLARWYLPAKPSKVTTASPQAIRLLISNVHTANRRFEKLIELIEREVPDAIVLCEVDTDWLEALADLHEKYPYRQEIPRSDNFGIAVFSRLPNTDADAFRIGHTETPAIEMTIQRQDRTLTIVAAHTFPPMGRRIANLRNEQLGVLGRRMTDIKGPRVLVGDLNVSMWSPYYHDLETTSGLVNARRGFGILPTWPTRRRVMMIPIDHCLHSDDVSIRDCRVGANIGSDHLPLIVDLVF